MDILNATTKALSEGMLWGEDSDYDNKIAKEMHEWIITLIEEMKNNGWTYDDTNAKYGRHLFTKNNVTLKYNDNVDKVGAAFLESANTDLLNYIANKIHNDDYYEGDDSMSIDFCWSHPRAYTIAMYADMYLDDYKKEDKQMDLQDVTIQALTESVSWDYFDNFDDVIQKYMPDRGEGDTIASQIVTAINKLVYKWYNDEDVYDNVHSGMRGWANDLSSYANWLNKYCDRAAMILDDIYECNDDDSYEDLLQALADRCLNKDYLATKEEPKQGSIYECDGPFEYKDYDEEDYDNDDDDYNDDDYLDEALYKESLDEDDLIRGKEVLYVFEDFSADIDSKQEKLIEYVNTQFNLQLDPQKDDLKIARYFQDLTEKQALRIIRACYGNKIADDFEEYYDAALENIIPENIKFIEVEE